MKRKINNGEAHVNARNLLGCDTNLERQVHEGLRSGSNHARNLIKDDSGVSPDEFATDTLQDGMEQICYENCHIAVSLCKQIGKGVRKEIECNPKHCYIRPNAMKKRPIVNSDTERGENSYSKHHAPLEQKRFSNFSRSTKVKERLHSKKVLQGDSNMRRSASPLHRKQVGGNTVRRLDELLNKTVKAAAKAITTTFEGFIEMLVVNSWIALMIIAVLIIIFVIIIAVLGAWGSTAIIPQ